MTCPSDLATVTDTKRAAILLNPLRLRLVHLAGEPASASELALRLGLTRQKVNYHVRQLARAGFLTRAGQVRKRNLIEQRYVATARAYVLAPEVLGPLGASAENAGASATRFVALAARAQADLSRAVHDASDHGLRIATVSIAAALRFDTADRRRAFADGLQTSIADLLARFSTSADGDQPAGRGRTYRLLVGWYPVR